VVALLSTNLTQLYHTGLHVGLMSARSSRKVAALPNYSEDEGDSDQLSLTVTPQRIHCPASSKSNQPVWPESQCDASPGPPPPYVEPETEEDRSALQTDKPESLWTRVSRTFFGYDLSTWNCTTQSSTEDTHTTLANEVRLDSDLAIFCINSIAA
jgi:hypothetical protein